MSFDGRHPMGAPPHYYGPPAPLPMFAPPMSPTLSFSPGAPYFAPTVYGSPSGYYTAVPQSLPTTIPNQPYFSQMAPPQFQPSQQYPSPPQFPPPLQFPPPPQFQPQPTLISSQVYQPQEPMAAPYSAPVAPPAAAPLSDITNVYYAAEDPTTIPFNAVDPEDARQVFPHRGKADPLQDQDRTYEDPAGSVSQGSGQPTVSIIETEGDGDDPSAASPSSEWKPLFTREPPRPASVPRVVSAPPLPVPAPAWAKVPFSVAHPSSTTPTIPRAAQPPPPKAPGPPAESRDRPPVMGVDLGSYQCRVALAWPSQAMPELVRNNHGGLQTRAVVALLPQQPRCVGSSAAQHLLDHPDSAFDYLKPLLDQSVRGVANPLPEGAHYEVSGEGTVHTAALLDGAEATDGFDLAPAQLLAMLLGRLQEFALQHPSAGRHPPRELLLTCPANWTAGHKSALKEAAVVAGFDPDKVSVASDTMAKMLWYRYAHYADLGERTTTRVMILDIGHSYSAACVANVSRQRVESLATCCCPLGADSVDRALVAKAKEWALGKKPATGPAAAARLTAECRQAKEALGAATAATIQIPGPEGRPLPFPIDRPLLKQCADDLLGAVEELCAVTLEQAGLQRAEVESVEVIGGGSRMPLLLEALKAFWGIEAPVRLSMDTDVAVCQGAAMLALQQEAHRDLHTIHRVELVPMIPKPVGIPIITPIDRLQPMIDLERDLQRRDAAFTDSTDARHAFDEFVLRVRTVCKKTPHCLQPDIVDLLAILDTVEEQTKAPTVLPSREGYHKSVAGLQKALRARFPAVYAEVTGNPVPAAGSPPRPTSQPAFIPDARDSSSLHRSRSVPSALSKGATVTTDTGARPPAAQAVAFNAPHRSPAKERPLNKAAAEKADFYDTTPAGQGMPPPPPEPNRYVPPPPPPPPPVPHHQLAHTATAKADALLVEKKWAESIDAYKQALEHLAHLPPSPKRNDRCCACHLNVAMAACKLADFQCALDHATRAIELCPKNAHGWRWKAEAQLGLERPEEASATFKSAQQIAQANHDAETLRQLALMERKYKKRRGDKCRIS